MWSDLKQTSRPPISSLLDDAGRAADFSASVDGMLFDYSKTSMTHEARALLFELAMSSGLEALRQGMFNGEGINATEGRAALHTALRNTTRESVMLDGINIMTGVRNELDRMILFAENLRQGRFQGDKITDVVNIGIGGSHLGPEMCSLALAPYHNGPRCHFVSNVDGADIGDCLSRLRPRNTIAIVASKTFATAETVMNAKAAMEWMASEVQCPGERFAAATSFPDRAIEFGIEPDKVFRFEDWVGGRYSIWGPVGLSLMIAIGADRFREFLEGAASMDDNFLNAHWRENMPLLLAMTGLWHHQVCGYASRAVIPYCHRLARLPAYFQQLEMESNGKGVTLDGQPAQVETGPIVWGEAGTNAQHSFFQFVHQGSWVVPCEFMVAVEGYEPQLANHQRMLVANCIAQSEALMRGRGLGEVKSKMIEEGLPLDEIDRLAPHRVFPGNRPSTTLIFDRLTPGRLGQIISLYEHRVFAEGVVLGINSFDQWGVELGKELAMEMDAILSDDFPIEGRDCSTRQLAKFAKTRLVS